MRFSPSILSVLFVTLCAASASRAQSPPAVTAEQLQGLQLRGIGPAVMGGRIADIAVHPRDRNTWYLAVGSGGVWKTVNAGTTWTPVFDSQSVYSVGCVAVDPVRPEVVWVGTGENVSGRHVGWGDGVYKSLDGGASWQRMGLEKSEHIGKILIDPRDPDVVFVAAEGPLWSEGGERGLYRTDDGGASWTRVLAIDEDTGVTDVEFQPGNPDVLYAASYQRRRSVWSLLAGGPGSGIHKSTDGGDNWRRLVSGLPKGDMGKIGLAVTPADPRLVYATIEASAEERGFYRSRDGGESWERRNEYISNGTGPHYYQEIEASPRFPGRVYQMDVFLHVTRDGGGSFDILETGRAKHSDNHALWIDPDHPDHLLVGTDGGLYESFDEGSTWRHFGNLPISQFYKMALDSSLPFYNVLGGAQDLGTLLGPSRTTNVEGVRNRDWTVPLGADGYACAFDPDDPNTVYMEWQVGRLYRHDLRTGEGLDIQPQPAPGDPPERWNWDAPLLVSPHSPARLYFGSHRLWRSDDRGDSWQAVSGDLTAGANRYQLPMNGRVRSVDALYDNGAMSWYATLTAVSESPLVEGLLYTGSDDGLIQVSEDGGGSWRAAGTLPGVPEGSFVNDLEASLHDPDAVFAVLDNHKTGDYRPLLFESRDRGRSWRSIAGDLPDSTIVWAVEQDHVQARLLFAATEFGLYATLDGGAKWLRLGGGVPTISFRDLELQRRDGDLVGASFGRGFYVLDDYAPLREMAAGALDGEAALFAVRDAWWYVPSVPMQAPGKPSQGSTDFTAPNPPFGAVFTYWLKEEPLTAREARRRDEKAREQRGEDVPFPGWERLREEEQEQEPKLVFTVRDASGAAVRRIEAPAEAGIHRVSWDLRLPPPDPVDLSPPGFVPPWAGEPQGPLAAPGRYRVEMGLETAAGVRALGEPREFEVKPLPGDSTRVDYPAVAAFQAETRELLRQTLGAAEEVKALGERLRHMRAALSQTPGVAADLSSRLTPVQTRLEGLRVRLVGDPVLGRWNEPSTPSVLDRVRQVAGGHWETRQPPTATQRTNLDAAGQAYQGVRAELSELGESEIPRLEEELEAAGAPWTPGRKLQD